MATKGFAHEDKNNLSVDWYTPAWIFERMGLQFDLDPCAPTGGVPWIPAVRHYDLEDNGLTSSWLGKVWLNPSRYGIVFLNPEEEVCKLKNAQNVVPCCPQQQNFSTEEKIDLKVCLQDVSDVQQFKIEIESQLSTSLLSQECSYINKLNLVLRFVPHALRENLCRLITLDCALRYEQGLTPSVSSVIERERERSRLIVELTLSKDCELLRRRNVIESLIEAERLSGFNLSQLITFNGRDTLTLTGTGVLSSGRNARETGVTNAPTAEKSLISSHKTTISPYLTQSALEQHLKTLCQPVGHVTALSNTNTQRTGLQGKLLKISKDTFNQFSLDVPLKVFLNPPYGKETPKWLAKMHQHRNGMALLFARTDCAWFHDYVAKADAILFLKGRVKFVDGLGVSKGSGAGSGSMLIAWGSQQVEALKRMEDLGKLICL